MKKKPEQNIYTLDEISRLNNELINIRRELTKKNSALNKTSLNC